MKRLCSTTVVTWLFAAASLAAELPIPADTDDAFFTERGIRLYVPFDGSLDARQGRRAWRWLPFRPFLRSRRRTTPSFWETLLCFHKTEDFITGFLGRFSIGIDHDFRQITVRMMANKVLVDVHFVRLFFPLSFIQNPHGFIGVGRG